MALSNSREEINNFEYAVNYQNSRFSSDGENNFPFELSFAKKTGCRCCTTIYNFWEGITRKEIPISNYKLFQYLAYHLPSRKTEAIISNFMSVNDLHTPLTFEECLYACN